jgi:hypothetical protein
MKAVSTLILGMCTAVATVTLATSHAGTMIPEPSHQAMVAAIPMPTCGPSGCGSNGNHTGVAAIPMPTCGPSGCGSNGNHTGVAAIPMPTCGPSGCGSNGNHTGI